MTSPQPAAPPPMQHQPLPPPPRPTADPPWTRSSTDRVVAGVCGGLGRRVGIDPVILRVVIVVLAFFAGAGLALYAAAWLFMPLDRTDRSVLADALGGAAAADRTRNVLTALALVAVLVVAGFGVADGGFVPGVLVALVVIAILLVLRRDEDPAGSAMRSSGPPPGQPYGAPGSGHPSYQPATYAPWAPPAAPQPGSADEPTVVSPIAGAPIAGAPVAVSSGDGSSGDEPTVGLAGTTGVEPTVTLPTSAPPGPPAGGPIPAIPPAMGWSPPDVHGGWSPPGWDPSFDQPPPPPVPGTLAVPPRPPRERSYLGVLTVSAMLAAIGVLSIVDLSGAAVPVAAYVATALAVVAAGLLVGAWVGRSRGLIALGVVLGLAMGPAVLADSVVGPDWGNWTSADDVRVAPRVPADLAPRYEYGAGQIRLDLTQLDFTGPGLTTVVDLGAGDVRVVVPPDVDVTVDASVDVGDLVLFDRGSSGFDADEAFTDLGEDGPGGGQLDLRIDLGLGKVEVRRAAS